MTYAYALLKVSPATYAEVRAKLEAAGYEHAFDSDGARSRLVANSQDANQLQATARTELLDMHGLALVEDPPAAPTLSPEHEVAAEAIRLRDQQITAIKRSCELQLMAALGYSSRSSVSWKEMLGEVHGRSAALSSEIFEGARSDLAKALGYAPVSITWPEALQKVRETIVQRNEAISSLGDLRGVHPPSATVVTLDPEIKCGQPVVTGTRVPAAVIASLGEPAPLGAGEPLVKIASEFGISPIVARLAIEWHRGYEAQRAVAVPAELEDAHRQLEAALGYIPGPRSWQDSLQRVRELHAAELAAAKEGYAAIAADLRGTERDNLYTDAIPNMKPGDERTFAEDGHTFRITAVHDTGFHTGRNRYRVECVTCSEVVHEKTTGPESRVLGHIRDARNAPIPPIPRETPDRVEHLPSPDFGVLTKTLWVSLVAAYSAADHRDSAATCASRADRFIAQLSDHPMLNPE